MRTAISTITGILAATLLFAACGRSAPAAVQFEPEDQVTTETTEPATSEDDSVTDLTTGDISESLSEPEPRVRGTFNSPDIGVKVTSANTVIEALTVDSAPATAAPATTSAPSTTATTATTSPPPAAAGVAQTYIVQAGDTLSVIANNKFDIKVAELLAVNNIGDEDEIKPGQSLNIPAR